MADDKYTFDLESIKRIARSVIRDEARIMNPVPPSPGQIIPAGWNPFKNNFAGTIPSNSVIALTGSAQITGIEALELTGDQPSTTFTRRYAITGGPDATQSQGGLCSQSGWLLAKYDTGTPAQGESWGPKPGQFTLSKGFPGFCIEGIVDSTNKIALVTLEPISCLKGKTTGAITALTSTTSYRFYCGTLGSESDMGFTTTPSAVSRVAISSGKWVLLTWVCDGWEMSPLECP